ncbi:MAG: hypothetical protein OEY44_03915 [Candidatus Peregrinibacteria bacterium]|nr:hypothetical protein [Candidatus Peregrinibacteria bacterium]
MTPRSGEIEGVKYEATRGFARSALLGWMIELDKGWAAHSYPGFELYDDNTGHFLLAYDSAAARDRARTAFDSLTVDRNEGVQAPNKDHVVFEYQGKHFLVVVTDYPLTDKSDEVFYKGVVVNPALYNKKAPDSEDRVVEGARESMRAIGQ